MHSQEMNRSTQRKVLKFVIEKLPDGIQINTVNPSPELCKIAWNRGTQVDQIVDEIKKRACMPIDSQFALAHNMIIFDQEDCAIILSEDMDFNQVYKVKFIPTNLMETLMRTYN